jgi:type IV secretory pathway VirD2 relaxase
MRGYRKNKKMSGGYARSGRAPLSQRCAVRVTYSRNKNAGQWKAHGHYLARQRATEKSEKKSAGFSRSETSVDIAQRLDGWQKAGDERLFKIIVSPEFGDRIDLESHSRQLMARMERDLKTELEWVAVIHYNTEHPHAHIALRGVDQRGKALRLPREYVKSGIRSRAGDLITKELGHRTIEDAIEAQRREVEQLRFTSLDRVLQRQNPAQADYFIVQCDPAQSTSRSFSGMREQHLAARLSKLEHMELAENLGGSLWRVRGDFAAVLRMIERTKDRQRVLAAHGALLSDERLPFTVTSFQDITHIEGRVVAHGQEEYSDRMYLMIEGVDGRVHFLHQTEEIQEARRQGQVRVNAFVRIEKQFSEEGRPALHVEDCGDAFELLHDNTHLGKAALDLVHRDVTQVERTWGGWLGQYQAGIDKHLSKMTPREREGRSRGLAR